MLTPLFILLLARATEDNDEGVTSMRKLLLSTDFDKAKVWKLFKKWSLLRKLPSKTGLLDETEHFSLLILLHILKAIGQPFELSSESDCRMGYKLSA
mmetsp:Transcript_2695/g.2825  ORF Transcript_2695/g.2825 Transcript_2695/m.2825 type:complete len:97 (-) Transcript_2695:1220-1510(-)